MKLQYFMGSIPVAVAKSYLRLAIILSVGTAALGAVSTALAANSYHGQFRVVGPMLGDLLFWK